MLKKISLNNYRNLASLELQLATSNVIIAPNGSGKSNLLESIYFANFAHSFRPLNSLQDILGPDGEFARVDLEWHEPVRIVVSSTPKLQVKYYAYEKVQPRKKVLLTRNVIAFVPQAMDIVSGEPGIRRQDMDDFLALLDPIYAQSLTNFIYALKQRNALLKFMDAGRDVAKELHFFEQQLVESGAVLYKNRLEIVRELSGIASHIGTSVYTKGQPSIDYLPKFSPQQDFATEYAQKLLDSRLRDSVIGSTMSGPHRDDYRFYLDLEDLKYRGSRGQSRIALMLYKLAQLRLLAPNKHESILLIDDITSELDAVHRNNIGELILASGTQFILTSSDERDVPDVLLTAQKVIRGF